MQIEIDFDVFKELTARRKDELDSYNEVIRRLLNLPASDLAPKVLGDMVGGTPGRTSGLAGERQGVWFANAFFPNGTKFRATYKGRTYLAEIRNEQWVDHEGNIKNSPSDAASSVTKTNVNGWRFWFAKRPEDDDWVRMDDLRP